MITAFPEYRVKVRRCESEDVVYESAVFGIVWKLRAIASDYFIFRLHPSGPAVENAP